MKWEEMIGILCQFVKKEWFSLLSLIVSSFCYVEYRKANKITLQIDERTKPNFDIEIRDSGYINNGEKYVYFFVVLITNLSDNPNSVKRITLGINYECENKRSDVTMQLSSSSYFRNSTEAIPFAIEGRNSKLYYAHFDVSYDFKSDKKFLQYKVEVFDLFDNKKDAVTTIINEVRRDG